MVLNGIWAERWNIVSNDPLFRDELDRLFWEEDLWCVPQDSEEMKAVWIHYNLYMNNQENKLKCL